MPDSEVRRFGELIAPQLDALFRTAYRFTRNQPDAEDLVQDTCVRAFLRIDELDESQPIGAWLMRVLHNLFIDGLRRSQRSPFTQARSENTDDPAYPESLAALDPNPEEFACAAEREAQLERAWLRLDRGHRALLALRAEGYTLSEMSGITGVATDVLTARLYRARRSLAHHLSEQSAPTPAHRKEISR
jgi:RNA polymerase sigma-70 factor, ECF subfamily